MTLNPFSDLYIKTSTPYSGDSVATEGQQRYEEKDPQHDEHQRQHSRSVLDGSRGHVYHHHFLPCSRYLLPSFTNVTYYIYFYAYYIQTEISEQTY